MRDGDMRILLAAEESAGIQTLKWLAGTEHEVVAVLASEPRSAVRVATVAAAARSAGVPVWPAELVKDPALAERLADEGVDVLLNVHSLFLVAGEVLVTPRVGSFNLHPGPLPRYAGLNTPSSAIYNGEREHGVTVHWMIPEIDAGPIAYEASFEIGPADTGLKVSAKCVRNGLPLLAELVSAAARGKDAIPAIEQDQARRRYFGAAPPHGGRIDWSLPARRIVDFVRASDYSPFTSPWGHPIARLGGLEVAVVKASLTGRSTSSRPGTLERDPEGTVLVAAADELVALERVQVDGASKPAGELLSEARTPPELEASTGPTEWRPAAGTE